MTPQDPRADAALKRSAALAASIDALDWCSMIPHTIDQVVGIHIEAVSRSGRPLSKQVLTNDELLAKITGRSSGDGGGGKGGHSDPTAMAALMGEPDAVDDADETLGRISAAIAALVEHADEADHVIAEALGMERWNPPPTSGTRTQLVAHTTARLHHATPNLEAAIAMLGRDAGHLDWLVRTAIHDHATWLHEKASTIWRTSRGEEQIPAVQRTITKCSCCTPFGYNEHALPDSPLCAGCESFRREYKCWPTRAIKQQLVDYGRKRLSSKLIDDAKAAAKKRAG